MNHPPITISDLFRQPDRTRTPWAAVLFGFRPRPVLNTALLQRTLETIEANLDRWDQRAWVSQNQCGTTYCLAGWAVVLVHGHEFTAAYDDMVPRVAREALGLTDIEARSLFHFTAVVRDDPACGGQPSYRLPTFADLVDRVEQATGYRYAPPGSQAPTPTEDAPTRELVAA